MASQSNLRLEGCCACLAAQPRSMQSAQRSRPRAAACIIRLPATCGCPTAAKLLKLSSGEA